MDRAGLARIVVAHSNECGSVFRLASCEAFRFAPYCSDGANGGRGATLQSRRERGLAFTHKKGLAKDKRATKRWAQVVRILKGLSCKQERSVPEPATPGSVVWVDFPFSDAQGSKRRPAVVVNSPEYFNSEKALILLMITSRLEQARCPTDRVILEWRLAGLREESAVRCRPSTVLLEDVEFLGRLHPKDFIEVMSARREALGI